MPKIPRILILLSTSKDSYCLLLRSTSSSSSNEFHDSVLLVRHWKVICLSKWFGAFLSLVTKQTTAQDVAVPVRVRSLRVIPLPVIFSALVNWVNKAATESISVVCRELFVWADSTDGGVIYWLIFHIQTPFASNTKNRSSDFVVGVQFCLQSCSCFM